MVDRLTLPALQLLDPDPADRVIIDGEPMALDQAVIVIDGREEETITIDCDGARDIAEQLVHLVNSVRELQGGRPPADEQQTPYRAIDF